MDHGSGVGGFYGLAFLPGWWHGLQWRWRLLSTLIFLSGVWQLCTSTAVVIPFTIINLPERKNDAQLMCGAELRSYWLPLPESVSPVRESGNRSTAGAARPPRQR
ncbi:hypothetical protein Nepgr_030291 [Nepenthes gracilis]|uniref:Uncharacterized protein n=1 Tax=Nepenthes gracilis TaxID=150966 RepID=A0AAD3TG76_NEPGR|nr:hypothetical protein Nepgr_030291 [Nepenthes gracilis]